MAEACPRHLAIPGMASQTVIGVAKTREHVACARRSKAMVINSTANVVDVVGDASPK